MIIREVTHLFSLPQMLADSEEAQIYMLRALYDLWSTHHQVKYFAICKP